MHRRFILAAPAILLGVAIDKQLPAFAQTNQSVWTSGGEDLSGWRHDEALERMVRLNLFPQEAAREFSLLANARGGEGRGYSHDPLDEGQAFGCMCFGGVKTSQKRMLTNVVAKPSAWKQGTSKEMRTWTWQGMVDGKRVTVGYAVPVVCGNSSALLYKNGAPVCVPIPHNAPRV